MFTQSNKETPIKKIIYFFITLILSFGSLFWAQPANANAVAEAELALQHAEQLVIDLTVQNDTASLEVSSANELVILAQESLDLANQEVVQKEFDVSNAQIAYDQNFITEIIYTDTNLTATVYNNAGFNASPPLPGDNRIFSVQQVANINFQWASGPVLGGPAEDVAVRFQGTITADTTGQYQFYGPADDGFMLRINGVTIINDWVDKGGGGTFSQPVILTAGQANSFEAWYYENGGGAWVQLYWNLQGVWQIVPPTAFDTRTTVQTRDPSLLLVLDSAIAHLNLSKEEQLIKQLNLATAIENYNTVVQGQQQASRSLQEAVEALPALQKALAAAIEAARPQPEPAPTPEPSPGENAGSEQQPSIPVSPEPEPSQEPSPEPTIPPQPEETEPPVEPTPTPEELFPEPEPIEPPIIEPEEESITSAEELPEELSAEELMQVDLKQIIATELSEAQVEALIEAALETFETAEQGSPEYEQALEALFVAAQADDIILDEALAAIPLLGDVLGGATELINFLGNAGADMSPQVREDSEKVVVTAIVAVQAALSAISISGIATTINIRSGA